jgi:Spy/CpxP family protein refolding chaperone
MLAQGFPPRGNGNPPDPATIVQNEVTRLTTLLSLTTDQATQATTIFTTAATTVSPLQSTLNTDRQSLRTAIKNNDTATIDQLSATIGTLSGQVLDAQSRADAAFCAILTADQQAKLDQLGVPGRGGFGGRPPNRP